MKKFILKVCLFSALCAAALLGAFAVYFLRMNAMSFALPPDRKILFIGDSHVEIGVNDALIAGAFNFAKSGDPYLDQLARLKKLLRDNPQIETVFVSVTPLAISRDGDARIFNGFTLQSIVPNALPIYSRRERQMYLSREPVTLAKFIFGKPIRLMASALSPSRKRMMARLGAYFSSSGRRLERSVRGERAAPHFRGNADVCGNALQIEYLRKIVDFTRSRGARVIFLNPPIFRAREFFDVPFFESVLRENFSDVEFWDYADFPVPDECRQDINHLNRWGAEIFSRELAGRMKREGIISEAE